MAYSVWRIAYSMKRVSREKKRDCEFRRATFGFTLVELMVVIGVAVLLMGAALVILSQVMQTANRAQISNELRQTGSQMMETMIREVRKARSVEVPTSGGTTLMTFSDAYCSIPAVAFSWDLTTSSVQEQVFVPDPTPTLPLANLTSGRVVVLDCGNTCSKASCVAGFSVTAYDGYGNPSASCLTIAKVTINLTVQQALATVRPEYCGKMKFSESVATRNY